MSPSVAQELLRVSQSGLRFEWAIAKSSTSCSYFFERYAYYHCRPFVSSLPSGWSEAVYELAPEFFTFCLRHGFWILLSELDDGRERGIRFLGRQERLTCTDERRVCERKVSCGRPATTDSPPSVRSQRLCD